MGRTYEVSIDIDASAEATWEVVGDPCGVTRWYPLYISCQVDGDTRIFERSDGATVVERMMNRDDANRSYEYQVLSGVPLREHHARFEVRERPGGSTVVWRTTAVPDDPGADPEERLAPRQREALVGLKRLLET